MANIAIGGFVAFNASLEIMNSVYFHEVNCNASTCSTGDKPIKLSGCSKFAIYLGRKYLCCRLCIYKLCCFKKDKLSKDLEQIK